MVEDAPCMVLDLHFSCVKYGYYVMDYCYRFEENYRTTPTLVQDSESSATSTNKHAKVTINPQVLALLAHTREYSLPKDLESQV